MSLKEIKDHHAKDNNTCALMSREMFLAHQERGKLLELVDEMIELLNKVGHYPSDNTVNAIDDFLSKIEGR